MSAPDPAALAAAVGAERVEKLERLTGGASRETWYFEADGTPLVLRRDPPGRPGYLSQDAEAALLRAAAAAGVPVPSVRATLEGGGTVMDFVAGESIPRRILRDDSLARARERLAAQCGEILARIHAIDAAGIAGLPTSPPGSHPAAAEIERFRGLHDSLGQPHPAFELAFRWLGEHLPPARAPRLVHGDFRHGNFLVGTDGIAAVLDWELAHLGDPMEDLGWLCVRSWRFGRPDLPVGGFGAREDLFAAYEKATSEAVDPEVVRFWEVFGNLKWGVICVMQAFAHLNGAHHSVELAAIGRRAAEPEWDLLELI